LRSAGLDGGAAGGTGDSRGDGGDIGCPLQRRNVASVSGCAVGAPGTSAVLGTMVMLLEIGSMRASTELRTPRPQADSKTTAETPMIRPSMVSAERSWWARSAIANASVRLISSPSVHTLSCRSHTMK
jgi:hypothetical protein